MTIFYHNLFYIGQGILFTLELLVGGLTLGMSLGLLFALLRHKKIGTMGIKIFISVMRGTPVILQLSFVYFSLPTILGIKISIELAGIVTFGLNSSAYISELVRAGIGSIPKGQFEAAKTLYIPNYYLWKDIILPQVFKNILPALINELIALSKETALIATIGGMDLMRRAQSVAAEQFTYFAPLCIAACYYYVLVLFIEFLGKKLEKRQYHVAY